jgi:hypothetical protein
VGRRTGEAATTRLTAALKEKTTQVGKLNKTIWSKSKSLVYGN